MEVTRLDAALPFEAQGHSDMVALRLQGDGASGADFAWVALSHFLPGGGAVMGSAPFGKIYVMLEGELHIEIDDGPHEVLRQLDSCFIPAGEARKISNRTNRVASMLVVTPEVG
jgi:quercetin dioxygenase-like cupin family protein